MPISPSPNSWPDYIAATGRLIDAMQNVLDAGRAAERRYEALQRRQDVLPAALAAHEPTLAQTHVHRRVAQLAENMYRALLGPTEPAPTRLHPGTLRALRHRI